MAESQDAALEGSLASDAGAPDSFYDSILLMYQKLRDLGFTYSGGTVEPP
jgi:hypothetical protein